MADTKISAGADPGTLVATDKVPVARSASTTAYAATMTEVGAFAVSVLPYAATSPSMDGTASPGAASTVSRGDHAHPTDTSRASLAAIPGINYADNAGFAVNQRAYVSGVALGAGVFGHDRWKGGAGGATYTFTASPPSTAITITAGTLQQVIEGGGIVGGNYVLSWTGTAQGRVGGGSYAASPVTAAGITAGANTTIEFNAGTLSCVKFESGTVATTWQALPPQDDLGRCQRFYQVTRGVGRYYSAVAGGTGQFAFPVGLQTMRVTPTTVTLANTTYANGSGAAVFATSRSSAVVYSTPTGIGATECATDVIASADL